MELQLFGINHKTSNVSEREKFIINQSNLVVLDSYLKKAYKEELVSFFGISTCNRTELYILGKKQISKEIFNDVSNLLKLDAIPKENFYFLNDHDALVHMCKVASGIDSQVLGEQEIFGQFKKALKTAKDLKIIDTKLLNLTNKVIEIVKKARTETDIGLNSLSVDGLALKLVRNIFEKPQDQNVLVVGAGFLANSLIKNLYKNGINKINLVNRSIKKIKLFDDYEIISSSLDNLHDSLEISDIVIASSDTDIPLIGKGAIENALTKRKNKPILLIDLGVPRNIEEEIRNIEQAYLFSIDDLEKITQENYGQRSIEAEKAMNLIVLESQKALDLFSLKSSKDKVNLQLEKFLKTLSLEEMEQFKLSKDYSELVKSIKGINIQDSEFNNFNDIKAMDSHVIESMIKRFFDNA
ncbi:MAG: glutamyl-tRNA reductase [Gammaproteobacteria bacterium]|mgnify:CR=1 FL=1|nr:glutamyl-tRNA reductase [Gammaproteobacteria bacterium]|tara:strand:+ start:1318 stop:2550 length:1233 start_codon:yes stop_codon:yes gene_type:complete